MRAVFTGSHESGNGLPEVTGQKIDAWLDQLETESFLKALFLKTPRGLFSSVKDSRSNPRD